ncbi:hypothetical protein [Pantoea dispersa]|nr:hypothetical protein [Pantoea dispersa]
MTDRPAHGDQPDYDPRKNSPEPKPKDDETSAPESGDKQAE